MDAVRRLAERAKIPLEFENSPGEQQSRHLKDQLLEIHEQLTQRWQNCLANEAAGQLARDYLAKRGVSADAKELYRLRRDDAIISPSAASRRRRYNSFASAPRRNCGTT